MNKPIRYLLCNLGFSSPSIPSESGAQIELLFVVSFKDSALLPFAIQGAINSTQLHEVVRVTLVCPRGDLDEIQNCLGDLVAKPISVIPEDEIIDVGNIQRLQEVFRDRAGWVLQQLLKIEFVKRSNSPGVLVVDADTILLKNRVWLDQKGSQILLPTWERHTPYYEFLEENSFKNSKASLSHVSHHMVFQPKILRELLSSYNIQSLENFIELLVKYASRGDSPFSIDYEMYAQFLLSVYPETIRYEKWSNLSLRRFSPSRLSKFSKDFHSVSAHSYNLD